MTGAATPTCKHGVFGVAVVIAAAALAGPGRTADAAAGATPASRAELPVTIQGLAVERGLATSVSKRWLEDRRSRHTTAVLVDPASVGRPLFYRVRRDAWAAGLRVLVPIPATSRAAGTATCARLVRSGKPCFLNAPSVRLAIALSSIRGSVVAVHLAGLAAFEALDTTAHGRIVGIVPLGGSAASVPWQRALALARSSARLDLAVAPRPGTAGARGLALYERLLERASEAPGVDPPAGGGAGSDPPAGAGEAGGGGISTDTLAPVAPFGLTKSAATATSIKFAWSASTDNVGVTGYGLYLGGGLVTSTPQTSATFAGLVCGTSYAISVDAYDAAGNRSTKSSISFATSACGGSAPADAQAPSVPSGLRATGTTTTSVDLAWNASTDNVGVAGYYVSKNGVRVATTTNLSYSFTGLACGTTFSLAVSAFDAAGNSSNAAFASTDEVTDACAGPPPPSGGASVYLAAGGSDSNACTVSAPCKTFDRAYRSAQPGQIVEVAGGTYGPQTISVDSSKTSAADVVFQPAAGATVTIGCPANGVSCLDIFGRHVTVRGMHVASMPAVNGFPWQGSVDTERGSDDVTLVDMDAGSINAAASNLSVLGGDWGPTIDPHNSRIVAECVNCLFDGLLIHDYAIAQGGHMECITFEGGTNVTIRNSEFRSCSVFSIFAKPTDPINGALIENNVFWNPRHFSQSNEIKFTTGSGGSCANIVIRYNVISDNIDDGCGNPTVIGNVQLADQATCDANWDYNVFIGATACGSHAKSAASALFVNAGGGDFHLQAGSPAVNAGKPGYTPVADRDGNGRPLGSAADAGVDEVG